MSKDFGWFLIWFGVVALVFVTPMNLDALKNAYVIPVGLIILGLLSIVVGFIGLESLSKVNGILFAVFVVLLIKAYAWNFPFIPTHMMFTGLPDNYTEVFTSNSMMFSCSVCESSIKPGSELGVLVKFNKAHSEVVRSDDKLELKSNDPLSAGVMNISVPQEIDSIGLDLGVGSIFAPLAVTGGSLNLSTGVGSININLRDGGFGGIYVKTGVGSIELFIDNVSGYSDISLNAGVGSIEVLLPSDIEYSFVLDAGLGSVDNGFNSLKSSGYEAATNKLQIKAETGVGSVSITKI